MCINFSPVLQIKYALKNVDKQARSSNLYKKGETRFD